MEFKKTELISTFLLIFLTGALASEQEYVSKVFNKYVLLLIFNIQHLWQICKYLFISLLIFIAG